MPDLPTLLTFALAALALLVIPGPSVLYIVARSMQQGPKLGLISALGVQTGGLVHVLAATIGVSALVMSSAVLFSIVKFLGAAYLIYLGIRTMMARQEGLSLPTLARQTPRQAYWQGAVVNALNPKTALFFLAFLPQFVHPARGPVWVQTVTLGLLFLTLATLSDGTYALLAGKLGDRLRHNETFARGQKYFTGGIYIALGLGTAAVGHQ